MKKYILSIGQRYIFVLVDGINGHATLDLFFLNMLQHY
jgi:hypothetical protein